MNGPAKFLTTNPADAGNLTVDPTDYGYVANASLSANSNGYGAETDPEVSAQWVLLALVIIPVWILGGNLLVLLAVIFQRNLQNLSNRVIASLAFTDLLLGIFVVPLGIYQLIQGQWTLGFPVCLMWTGSDVILSTASIMHLCAIALYRYHGIAHPLHVRSYATEGRHVTVLVVPAWSVAVALSIPFLVQGVLDRSHVLQPIHHVQIQIAPEAVDPTPGLGLGSVQCGIFNRTFAVYSSLVSFFIPLSVMVFADIRSIRILRRNIRIPILLDHAAIQSRHSTASGGLKSPSDDPTMVVESTICHRRQHRPNDDEDAHVTATVASSRHPVPTMTSQNSDSMATTTTDARERDNFEVLSNGAGSDLTLLGSPTTTGRPDGSPTTVDPTTNKRRSRSRSMVYLDMLASCGKTKVNGRERRAEKTLIWVFASFVALWLPFFCTNLAYGFCGDRCDIPGQLFQAFTWLGYLSSGVNPCIYTLLNKDFRAAFRNLLLCHHEKLTRTNHSLVHASTSNGTLRGVNNS